MKENEIAKLEYHAPINNGKCWVTIQIFNKLTKKKTTTYGPFEIIELINGELDSREARQFAKEHGIVLQED